MTGRGAGPARAPSSAPLGVFDSGLGGLTVVRALRKSLPDEDIVYLGDTARVPYGTRGPETVVKYAVACARHLVGRGVKAIVIACNTVSAVAPDKLRIELDLPVLSVIEPGARAAVRASRTARIGVLATPGTIASGAYLRAISQLSTRAEVTGKAAPLLVPLAEEGWTEGEVPRLAAERYLEPFAKADVDTIILGCTHYPLLKGVLTEAAAKILGPHVTLVDSADETASDARSFLGSRDMLSGTRVGGGRIDVLVTDMPRSFAESAARFLGSPLEKVTAIDL